MNRKKTKAPRDYAKSLAAITNAYRYGLITSTEAQLQKNIPDKEKTK